MKTEEDRRPSLLHCADTTSLIRGELGDLYCQQDRQADRYAIDQCIREAERLQRLLSAAIRQVTTR